ncbi:MAG: hypothetical protein F6K55_30170 [Moorea sp. SIO4A3]|nr:hypothetical protein [Moorena sp. SIO4A3]
MLTIGLLGTAHQGLTTKPVNNLGQKATLRQQHHNFQPPTLNLQPHNLQP